MPLLGRILKNKLAKYKYPSPSTKHKFGILLDETDSEISNYISEIEKHPFAKADCKILSFRGKDIPHKYDYSYLKEDLPLSKWPIQKEVENFIRHEFVYFIPLVKNWKPHLEVIARLVRAEIKFADINSEDFIDWNICLGADANNPMEFINFTSNYIIHP